MPPVGKSLAGLRSPHVAAGLLPVVEQLEPERLAECLGRTLGCGRHAEIKPILARSDRLDSKARPDGDGCPLRSPAGSRLLEPELGETGNHPIRAGIAANLRPPTC